MRPIAFALAACLAAAPATAPATAEELRIYNWAGYIGSETLEGFTAETGIEVVYDSFDSLETLEAKLLVGGIAYDLVVYVGPYAPKMLSIGVFQPLDKEKLSGWENLDPTLLAAFAQSDPGNAHGLPYLWSTTGITYNVPMVRERLGRIPENAGDLIFDPETTAKLADCGISLFDSPTDVLPMALAWRGLAPSSADPADYEALQPTLEAVRPQIAFFDNQMFQARLAAGELCVATTWSGDYARAMAAAAEAGRPVELGYGIPSTGAPLWLDAFFIPANAQNPEAAHRFLAYLLKPEVMASITDELQYASANAAANALVAAAIRDNPAIFPDEATKERLFLVKPLPDEVERVRTTLWQNFKAGF